MAEPLRIERHVARPHGMAPSLVARAPRLALPFGQRSKSRLRAYLNDGREAALFLARGTVLRGGDLLIGETGEVIVVVASDETVMEARTENTQALIRAAYHLGNRHIQVEFGPGCLRLEMDSVLKTMLEGLGLEVHIVHRAFEPEGGAYGGGHRHGHEETFTEDYALAQAAFAVHQVPGKSRLATIEPSGRHAHPHSHPHPQDHDDGHGHPDAHLDPKASHDHER